MGKAPIKKEPKVKVDKPTKGVPTEPVETTKTPETVEPEKEKAVPIEEQIVTVMKQLEANGIKEVISRLISDKLGLDKETGRGVVRRAMKALEKDGKVVISKKEGAKRQYAYKLKE